VTAVLIHPSGIGNPAGARNWRNTIEQLVDFRRSPVASALSADDRATLDRLHPDGAAPFWGTHRFHEARVAELEPGDVVAFTGKKLALAFGRIGLLTDNPRLGDALWLRHPDHGSYRFVYSLAPIVFSEMPQTEFRARGGFGERDDFRQLRVLTGDRADEFLAEFADEIPLPVDASGLSPVEREIQEIQDYESADADVARDLSWVRELRIEIRSAGDSEVRARASSTMHRGENLLVHDYVQALPAAARWCRYDTLVGVTDLDVHHPDGRHELMEAKSSAARTHIRQALAQLLDYAPSLGGGPPNDLSVLVPSRPSDSAVALLHRYGVDCVYRRADGSYERLAAQSGPAAAIAALWSTAAQG